MMERLTSQLKQSGDNTITDLPPKVLEALGLKVGDEVVFVVEDNHVYLKKANLKSTSCTLNDDMDAVIAGSTLLF